MRRLLLLCGLVLCMSRSAMAQQTPKFELFGGYSLMRADFDVTNPNMNGWNASLAGNVNKWVGLVADFGGHYETPTILGVDVDVRRHLFLFGPRVSFRQSAKATPFVQALFGVVHDRVKVLGVAATDTSLGMALGTGVDVRVIDWEGANVAFRLFQAEYVMTRFSDQTQNNIRLSFGFVFRFGKRK